ncbi:hypothetical protein [Blastococcus sp. CCUG 61487]|uniref:hypothetical protein n=1 Tax=Blastococcus sp. CCUG 61487 TaxID=1840703 RepID=UPI0010C016B2|nr:hypothetical protein [Blastococcus sp. CCUG 61487]
MPRPPSEFAATFDVESPIALVAGEGQAWVLTSAETGASLARIDHTGRSTDVVRLPGQSHAMAPYGDGVVVTRLACAAEECEETAVRVSVVDRGGATLAEEEFAREWGGLVSSFDGRGVELVGVHDDVVWVEVDEQLIGHDVADGRTAARVEAPQGVTCLLADGMHTLVPLDGGYFGHGGIVGPGIPEQRYDAEVHRLDGETWTPVPGSAHPLTDTEFQLATCIGGGLYAGERSGASPVWSPASGWVEREPLRRYPDLATAPEPTALGSADQLFVLESAGVIRRWFAGPDGPMSSEVLEVPAELFVQPYAPQVHLMVDVSDAAIAGCIQTSEERPTARCWIGSH